MEEPNFKQIPLKNRGVETGKFAKCSPQHYDEIMKYNWGINELKGGYAETYGYFGKKISMHKYIITVIEKIEIPDGYLIDHKDISDPDNQLNNCIDNLRLFTPAQNSRNQRKRKNCSSNLIGVYYQKKSKKYQSHFVFNGDNIYLGIFDSEIEAGMARDAYIVQNNLIKEGYSLNFNDKIDELKTYNILKKPKLSKFKNVAQTNNGNYISRIEVNKKRIFYYRSKNEIECAKKYDEFVVNNNLYMELNFPDNYPDFNPPKPIKNFKIDINDKICKIKLNSGKETIIDIESYEKLKYYKLTYMKKLHSNYGYVSIKISGKNYMLSRYLMNEKNPKNLIDHIDNNTLNNCLDNLRQSNYQRNAENKKKRITKNSINYTNVTQKGTKFIVTIQNQSFKYCKTHLTEEYAARDRDLQYIKRIPNSHYKIYFDWSIPGEIEKWEDLLFLEEIDMMFNKYKS